jgi:cytochrome bd ubiquinol oxidase subunit II
MQFYAYAVAVLLWLSMIAYAVLGGADFGGGIWNVLYFGPHAKEARNLIKGALGPVWEANNVWLIFVVVGLYTGFPIVAATLANALFIPLTLALIGFVLRSASFAFRTSVTSIVSVKAAWGTAFGVASLITPFLLGTCAGAVASGQIPAYNGQQPVGSWHSWLSPFAIIIGIIALAICATIAAVFLTVEAQRINKQELMKAFRLCAFTAGGVTALLGLVALFLAPSEARPLWQGMLNHGLWAVAITMLIGLATAIALFFRRYSMARVLIVMETVAFLGTWGIAQLPYILPPRLTIPSAASPARTMTEFFYSALIGALVMLPSLWFLFHVFKFQQAVAPVHEKAVREG